MKEYYRDLQSVCTAIGPLNEGAMEEARARQAMLAKPPGSLDGWRSFPYSWPGSPVISFRI